MYECPTCLIHRDHGGKCEGKSDGKPCLIFKHDPKGRRQYLENVRFDIPFHAGIPEIGKENTDWTMRGIEKTLTITRIRNIEWHSDVKGLHGIHFWADFWYWSDENGELLPEKPRLRLVKNGGK